LVDDTPDPLRLIGVVIEGRFRVEAFASAGASASVYRAREVATGFPVAVKVLDLAGMNADLAVEFRRRFVREGQAFSELSSPHTVRLFHVGTLPGEHPYLALEWVEGETLNDRFRSRCPLPVAEVLSIALQVVDALGDAHAVGVVHRDIKPGNILLTSAAGGGDFVKLADFGLAKDLDAESTLTRTDALVGTPTFMSPEQILGAGSVDGRSDLYSLGVVLFLGLTGKRPFGGKRPTEVINGHLRQPVPSMAAVAAGVSVPRELEWVVRTCLEKDREDRFADAAELRRALRLCTLIQRGEERPPQRLTLVNGRLELSAALLERLDDWQGPTLELAVPTPPVVEDPPRSQAISVVLLMAVVCVALLVVASVGVWTAFS